MKTKKKDAFEKTKIVIRHLPPSLSQSHLLSQFDHLFSNRYSWFRFQPGKPSQKNQRCSRAYIDFNSPADVLEFAEFFHGHVFVNEKGSQFKAIVEYAPSQRVPKSCARKDAREGAIYKDPDYLEFLKHIAKPVENLPSAEIQLERKEAEQSGAEKEPPIATPLMEFVRQKRAAEGVNQGLSATLKISKRVGPAALAKRAVGSTKRNSDKKKYIPKDSRKNTNRRDKPIVITHRHEDHLATSRGKQVSEVKSGSNSKATFTADSVMKKLLLRGKEHEISLVPQDMLQLSGPKSATGNSPVAAASKVNQRHKTGERLIRSILLNNEAHQSKSSTASQPQQKSQNMNVETDKRPPRAMDAQVGFYGPVSYNESDAFISDRDGKRSSDDKFMKRSRHGLGFNEKREKYTRNKDIPNHGVQILNFPLKHSDIKHSNEEHLLSTMIQHTESYSDSPGVTRGEQKDKMDYGNNIEETRLSTGSNGSPMEYGSNMNFGNHGKAYYNVKADVSVKTSRGKPPKRGGAIGPAAAEKQVWVQKPTSSS